jgi:hypothetical protein
MDEAERLKYLKTALLAVGGIFIVGLPGLMWLWPGGWTWAPAQPEYEWMMVGIYATLGVFLILAAQDPPAHASLIWFTIASTLVDAAIMLFEALADPTDRVNLVGDVPALYALAGGLWYLMPRRGRLG